MLGCYPRRVSTDGDEAVLALRILCIWHQVINMCHVSFFAVFSCFAWLLPGLEL